MVKVQFICKKRVDSYGASFGLLNSAKFVSDMLQWHDIDSEVITVQDNNAIDREVTRFKPTHVVIEALWVVPEKFVELAKRHPKIQWIVRIHSKVPFLAQEGIALQWVRKYEELRKTGINILMSPNSPEMKVALDALGVKNVLLPNIYDPFAYTYENRPKCLFENNEHLNIGCFGAIRPMKNHLQQAIAAIKLADELGKTLRFHINGNRIEQRGEEVLKNVRAAFDSTPHKLIEHAWMPHFEFLSLVMSMDLGLQVSLSESFNIVAADFALCDVPIVGSEDIDWLSSWYTADPNNVDSIKKVAKRALWLKKIDGQRLNRWNLKKYNKWSQKTWLKYFAC